MKLQGSLNNTQNTLTLRGDSIFENNFSVYHCIDIKSPRRKIYLQSKQSVTSDFRERQMFFYVCSRSFIVTARPSLTRIKLIGQSKTRKYNLRNKSPEK